MQTQKQTAQPAKTAPPAFFKTTSQNTSSRDGVNALFTEKRAGMKDGETYGPPELCAWQVVPGVFWIQTTEPQFSRKLEKREDVRRVEISGVNHFRRTFELRGSWRKIRRLIDRYLVSAGDRFSGDLQSQGASKDGGSITTAACSNRGATGVLIPKGGAK
jgi:hypothetical protein